MIIDMHAHIAGVNKKKYGNFLTRKLIGSLPFKIFSRHLDEKLPQEQIEDFDDLLANRVLSLVDQSIVDKVVMLALDGVYSKSGHFQQDKTQMICSNDFVHSLTLKSDKILFGASVHPYRADALGELKKCHERAAVLIKWIPSSMEIDPLDEKCIPFYDFLAEHSIMLLSHTGVEHSLKNSHNQLNNPRRLELALSRGVKVIAAHSGTHLFLHEKSYYSVWKKMALKHKNFYGDISAFCIPTRVKYLRDIINTPALHSKVFYGSDFPAFSIPLSLILKIGYKKYRELKKIKNPFDKSYLSLLEYKMPEEIFSQFEQHIRK